MAETGVNLPLLRPVRDTLKTWHQSTAGLDKYEASIRPVIDSGYSRNDKPKTATPETPAKAPTAKPVKRPNPLANLFRPPVKATPKPKAATAAARLLDRQEALDRQRARLA